MPEPQELPAMAPQNIRRSVRAELVAGGLTLAWLVAAAVWLIPAPEGLGTSGYVMTLLLVLLPVAVIWVALVTLRALRELRAEARQLQVTLDQMRTNMAPGGRDPGQGSVAVSPAQPGPHQASPQQAGPRVPARQLDAPATFASRRDASRAAAPRPTEEQPALALGTPAEDLRPPLAVADFIRALQFPESPDDKEGFRAMRAALEDRGVSKLIRAAQDVLTLLAQEGIYMDDLTPERARPELWRSFAQGERGRSISGLGGIRDRSSLALTAGRMREDPIFRDAAHHFLRTFDRTFAEFEARATDSELIELADSRTARAFMLFGRVAGVFD